ncbi:flagellar hook-basal body complex protein FliE [Romboutsia sp.]|uniref:flagellar hook-basal body complex protein FliE n=1 Tax=Romboutsia sp. TaxID=1965302 RepID=UPI002BC2838F|nr:flagellar hook-basal body complex protein FliE [Romboutsia sp.]HSQ87844.1 flagellar hook-basal body complex protein FliE [Romboutsia sp.]
MQGITGVVANSNIFAPSIKNEVVNKESKVNFSDVIKDAVNKVNETQVNANNMIEGLIKGEDVSMHDVMLSVQESQMSMQLMLEVRNKLFEAYQEVNRVQL